MIKIMLVTVIRVFIPGTGSPRNQKMNNSNIQNTWDTELLGNENNNPIERELANTINCSMSNNDTEASPSKEGVPYRRMKLRIFAVKIPSLDTIGCLNLWKYSK